MVVHAYGPSYLGGGGRKITGAQEVQVAVSHHHSTVLYLKKNPGRRLPLSAFIQQQMLDLVPEQLWELCGDSQILGVTRLASNLESCQQGVCTAAGAE